MWTWMLLMSSAIAKPVTDLDWRVVNDTVMGGVSRSAVEIDDTLEFQGTLSLERGGGFVSMRARTKRDAFVGSEALRLVLIGDGRTYDLTLARRDVSLRAGSYRARVETSAGRTEVTVPLSAFRPTSFGRIVEGAPALDTGLEQIVEIGVMLADKQPGPFALEVVSIELVPASPTARPGRPAVRRALMGAVDRGVPLFNQGEAAACADTYRAALRGALDLDGLTAGEVSLVSEALAAAERQRPEAAAWTLRHAVDSVLRSP